MIHFERSAELDATPEDVWGEISRFMHIDEFAPQVTSVEALSDAQSGVGAVRRCHFENGGSMVEEVLQWEPNSRYRVKGAELDPMPLTDMEAEIALAPIGGGRTRVTWSADYAVKYGPIGWIMGQTMMKMMMGKVLDGNLAGLADKLAANKIAAATAS